MAMAPNPGRRGSTTGANDPSGTDIPRGAMHEPTDIPRAPIPHTAGIRDQDRPLTETERSVRGATPVGGVGGDIMPDDSVTTRNGGYRSGTSSNTVRPDRSFTMTFAIAAVVLLLAFLVALYFGSQSTDTATAPTATQESLTENAPADGTVPAPGTVAEPGETTGSTTTPSIPPATLDSPTPGTGNSGTATTP